MTNAARKISTVGGSLDAQQLAAMPISAYIDANPEAQIRVVGMV